MRSWVAAHWTPGDLPGLALLIRLYDATERGQLVRAGELRMWLDSYGLTPKGVQDRRWLPPAVDAAPPAARAPERYRHLAVIDRPEAQGGSRG
jgi:hypothetical protein